MSVWPDRVYEHLKLLIPAVLQCFIFGTWSRGKVPTSWVQYHVIPWATHMEQCSCEAFESVKLSSVGFAECWEWSTGEMRFTYLPRQDSSLLKFSLHTVLFTWAFNFIRYSHTFVFLGKRFKLEIKKNRTWIFNKVCLTSVSEPNTYLILICRMQIICC